MMQSLSVHPFYCKLVSSLSPVWPLTLLRPWLALPCTVYLASHHYITHLYSHNYTSPHTTTLAPSPPLSHSPSHTHTHHCTHPHTTHTLSHYHTLPHTTTCHYTHTRTTTPLSHSFTLTSTCILRCVLKEDRSTVKMDRESSKTAGTADVPFLDRERQSWCLMRARNGAPVRKTGPLFCRTDRISSSERTFDL